MGAALELSDLACSRGIRRLFSGVSARVGAGRLLRVGGENGAGKTSLLRIIAGLARADRGEVRWQGSPIAADRDAFNRGLCYLGHAPALKEELSALENLQAASLLAGQPCSTAEAAAALASAGLEGREHLAVRLLSQGQRRRAALARLALTGADRSPDRSSERDDDAGCEAASLWVLDEPFSALDDAACRWLQGLVAAQLAGGGVVVMTSHERQTWDAGLPRVALTLGSAGVVPPTGQTQRAPAPEFA